MDRVKSPDGLPRGSRTLKGKRTVLR